MSSDNPKGHPPGTDGWIHPQRQPRPTDFAEPHVPELDLGEPQNYPLQRTQVRVDVQTPAEQEASRGKAMAVLAHLSILFGVPVFLAPLFLRNNALALHHAKAAAVIYVLFLLTGVLSFFTCALAFPLAMLCYVPALIGIARAAHGEKAGRWGLGDLGERIFSGIEVKDESR